VRLGKAKMIEELERWPSRVEFAKKLSAGLKLAKSNGSIDLITELHRA
jgi:hypothetical protein